MGGVEGFEMDEDDEISIVSASGRNQDRERLPHEGLSSDSSKAAAAAGGVPCFEELQEQHRRNEGGGVAPGEGVEEETAAVQGAEASELQGRDAVAPFALESETILEEKATEPIDLLATATDDVIRDSEQRPLQQRHEEQEGAVRAGMMQEGMAARYVEATNAEGIASIQVKYGLVSEPSAPVPVPSLRGASDDKVGSEILLPVDDAAENVDQKHQEHQLEEEGEGVRDEVMLEAVVSRCEEATEEGIAADSEFNGEAPGPPSTVHIPYSWESGEERLPSIALLPTDDVLDEDEQKHLQNFQVEETRGMTIEMMQERVVTPPAEAAEEVLAATEVRDGQVTESPGPALFPSVPGESQEKVGSTVLLPVLDIVAGSDTQMHLQEDEGVRKELLKGVLSQTLEASNEGISDHNMEGMQLFESPTTTPFPSSSGVAAAEIVSVYSLPVLDTNKTTVEQVEVSPTTVEAVKNVEVTPTMVDTLKDVEVTTMTTEALESRPMVAVTMEEVKVTPTKSEGLKMEPYVIPTRAEVEEMESELKPMMVGIVQESVTATTITEAVEVEVKPGMVETLEPVEARTTMGEAVEEVRLSSMMTEASGDLGQKSTIAEALEEKTVLQRMNLSKIKDEQTSQSIIGADVSMEDGMGLIAPMPTVDDSMDDVEQDEMAASMMAVQEDHETALEDGSRRGGKKRGRPPKAQVGRVSTKKKEEEDVCFICFDGGNLVLCDRRGCPKVYHPSCVNRDEAFFRSKGRWNCGWHICSICEKAAHYMCFTCTYSLCKSCIKEAQFVCVRGNKGFCETCRTTVMLIETNEREKKGETGVNFDDRSSWEYLFKDYWLDLKGKLSITLEEVSRAKNPWKGSSARNEDLLDEPYDAKDDLNSSSDSSSGHHQRSKPTKKKVKKSSKAAYNGEQAVRLPDKENASLPVDSEWASKELLEFVAHMRNGDTSAMCQFDVHTLLLEYIKQNNLRDPRRKSQIICDARLENLFGKARVGHFEMLKLLESHFLAKETSQLVTDDNQGSVLDPESSQMDNDGNSNSVSKTGSDKKQKSRKKVGKGEHQSNLDDFAAIDVHNISLVYLRRNLMEELLDDTEFNDKVVGSFVRIRISGAGLRKDMYRLVQVIGTSRAEEKYKTGKKTTDISLEILNLSKTEVVSIDSISNQEFTERSQRSHSLHLSPMSLDCLKEECKRLRQSIKCGLINRLTVGDIQGKAQALQSVRVNESLENEKLRLSHLRDRASEKGHRKELRECVEKLQLLNSPEERSRRLNEVPVVHADPKMDPNYESDEEEFGNRRPESSFRSRDSSFAGKRRESNHSGKGGLASSDSFSDPHRGSGFTWEPNKAAPARDSAGYAEINGATSNHRKEKGPASWDPSKALPSTAATDHGLAGAGQSGRRPGPASETSPASQGGGALAPLPINDSEKIWHYKDPSGKIQGPFSMTQLRKWNTTGYFPANLRIWRASEKEEDSILLTDALLGKFHRDPSSPRPQLPKVPLAADVGRNEVGGALASQSQSSFLGNSYQLPVQGRGEGGDPGRWHGSPNQGNAWAPSRAAMVQPHGHSYERQNSGGREPLSHQPANRSLWGNDSQRLTSVGLNEAGGAALAMPVQAPAAPPPGAAAAGRDSQRFGGVVNEFAPRAPLTVEMMNPSVGGTSSDCLTPTPKAERAKFDALNPEPVPQTHIDLLDSNRKNFELHQRYNISVPTEVLPEPGMQNHHQNPGQSHASTSEQRSEWSMPSPTPTVEPSRYDAGQSGGGKKMEHGAPQETMAAAAAPVAAAQGPGGAAWGALMQGNTGGVWVAPPQANPAASIGWGGAPVPTQANPNVNLLWVAQAQAQAYPGWGAPVQGAPNPSLNSAGWLPAAPPANVQPIPNWGVAAQQGASNPTQTWVLPPTDGSTGPGMAPLAAAVAGGGGGGGGGQSLQSSQPGPDSGQQGWARAAPPGGGDPSWGAPRGQDVGICKFYERGHCKKGDACNYMHFR